MVAPGGVACRGSTVGPAVVVAVGDTAIGLAMLELAPARVIGTSVIERAQALRSKETNRRPDAIL